MTGIRKFLKSNPHLSSQFAPWYLNYRVNLIFLGSETLRRLHQCCFFRVWTIHISSAYNLQFRREETRLPLLFLNNKNSWLYFCTLFFVPHVFDPIFFRFTNRPKFLKLKYLVQIDWVTALNSVLNVSERVCRVPVLSSTYNVMWGLPNWLTTWPRCNKVKGQPIISLANQLLACNDLWQ